MGCAVSRRARTALTKAGALDSARGRTRTGARGEPARARRSANGTTKWRSRPANPDSPESPNLPFLTTGHKEPMSSVSGIITVVVIVFSLYMYIGFKNAEK